MLIILDDAFTDGCIWTLRLVVIVRSQKERHEDIFSLAMLTLCEDLLSLIKLILLKQTLVLVQI